MVVQELSHEYSVRRRLRRRQAEAAATKTVSALLPRLHVENASASATGRRVTGLASRQHPEYGATSQHAPATESPSTSSTDDHQGEAARLSRVCRGLGLTFDAPRLRQAARWNYAKLISWTWQIIAAGVNPSGGVQSAIHRRVTELLLVDHVSSRMCRRWLG